MSKTASASLPLPPSDLWEEGDEFRPAPELDAWVRDTLLKPGHRLFNRDHEHLEEATIGWLWTNVPNGRHMRTIVGTAELGRPSMGTKWSRARAMQQQREWFGIESPDFIITLFAPYFADVDERNRLALIEHEMYHCSVERDEDGEPQRSHTTGRYLFGLRGHDVEEFVGVVRRYGMSKDVRRLVEAAQRGATLSDLDISRACGTCK